MVTMSLKCTVFGHRFGKADVERSRVEEGSEVVITIREVETCLRCGHQRTVSENTEVTTVESRTPAGEAVDEPAPEPSGPTRTATGGGREEAEAAREPTDDAVVREAEPSEDRTTSEAGGGPPASEDSAEPARDDGVILEETTEREPGAWPEEPEDDGPGWEPPTDPVPPDPDLESTSEAVSVPEGTFRCPECAFSTPVESSSLREGDFCPECHTGTLAHEADSE